MKNVQIWRDDKNVLKCSDSITEELFQDENIQCVFYSLKKGETITITPEPFTVSVMVYVLEGELLLNTRNNRETLKSHNNILISNPDISYTLISSQFSKIMVITSAKVQDAQGSEKYTDILKQAEQKDKYTYGHGYRVGRIAMRIAREYDSSYDLIALGKAATLHDIGKINTPVEILLKPGKLTMEEFEIIKQHPVDSYQILCEDYPEEVLIGVLQHHERLNGSGYPYGLKKDAVSLNARIIAVADVFDAMTSNRNYHEADSDDEVLQYLESCVDAYDMRFVKILKDLVNRGEIDYIRSIMNDKNESK